MGKTLFLIFTILMVAFCEYITIGGIFSLQDVFSKILLLIIGNILIVFGVIWYYLTLKEEFNI